MGGPGRDRVCRRAAGRRGARSQRLPSGAHADVEGRTRLRGIRKRDLRYTRSPGRTPRAARSWRDAGGRPGEWTVDRQLGAEAGASRGPALSRVGSAHHQRAVRSHGASSADGAHSERIDRDAASPLWLHLRGDRTHRAADGRRGQGSHRLDGRRYTVGGVEHATPAAAGLLPAALRAGHQPATRPAPRAIGHVAADADWQARMFVGRGCRRRAHGRVPVADSHQRPVRGAARTARAAVTDAVDHLRGAWRRVRLPVVARPARARRRRCRAVGCRHPDALGSRRRYGTGALARAAGDERGVPGARSRGPRDACRTRGRYRRGARCASSGDAAGVWRVGDPSVAGVRDGASLVRKGRHRRGRGRRSIPRRAAARHPEDDVKNGCLHRGRLSRQPTDGNRRPASFVRRRVLRRHIGAHRSDHARRDCRGQCPVAP